ncbi:MAG: hypothetical protein Q9183_007830, partial [Haloplaca sp. 2 TL-2023]
MASSTSPPMPQCHGPIRQKPATPHRMARFSPYILSQKTPSGLSNLTGHPHTHPDPHPPPSNLHSTPNTSPPEEIDTFQRGENTHLKTWHIKPDFCLIQPDGRQVYPSPEQRSAIRTLFPTCFCVEHAPPFLVLRCQTLPPKPWPVSLAGLPLYLTTEFSEYPIFMGVRAFGPKLHLDAEIRMWKTPDTSTFMEISRAMRIWGAKF